MKSVWKSAIMKFLLESLGKMKQEDVEAWMGKEFEFALLLEPAFRNLAPYRDAVLRELYQISPSEVFDAWHQEHPEILFTDNAAVVIRIGGEMAGIRSLVQTFGTEDEAGKG